MTKEELKKRMDKNPWLGLYVYMSIPSLVFLLFGLLLGYFENKQKPHVAQTTNCISQEK